MPQKLYLEDLAVGQRFKAGSLTISEQEIVRFARDYDPQYFHLDAEAAKSSMFGGLVASGWQTAALTMRMLIEGGAPFADGTIGAGGELAWPRPVRPGDTLHIESEVIKITPSRSRADRGIVTFKTTTFNQKDEPVQILTANLIVFSRAGRQ
ncbi:MAG: MaoC family dehydratase [Methylocystis sp.]|jgi:acyl dehydratase